MTRTCFCLLTSDLDFWERECTFLRWSDQRVSLFPCSLFVNWREFQSLAAVQPPPVEIPPWARQSYLCLMVSDGLCWSDHYKLVSKSIETLQHPTWPAGLTTNITTIRIPGLMSLQSCPVKPPSTHWPGQASLAGQGRLGQARGKWFYNCDEQKLSKSGKIRGTSKLLLLQTHHLCCSIYQSSNKVTTEIFSIKVKTKKNNVILGIFW